MGPQVLLHGLLQFQFLGTHRQVPVLTVRQLSRELEALLLLPLGKLFLEKLQLLAQFFLQVGHVVFVLMILLLVFHYFSPLYRDDLVIVLILVAPLNTQDIAFPTEAQQHVIAFYREKLAILENAEALHGQLSIN
jgi:hypothetical protein